MVDRGRFGDKLNFKYKTEYFQTSKGTQIPKQLPKIQIIFRRFAESRDIENNREFPTFALVDSGADLSHLPLKIANLLRLEIEDNGEKILTVAGEVRVFNSKVHVEIPRHGLRPVQVGMINLMIIDKEVEDKHVSKLIILGRKDFFEKFEITFNESSKYLVLRDLHKDEISIRK